MESPEKPLVISIVGVLNVLAGIFSLTIAWLTAVLGVLAFASGHGRIATWAAILVGLMLAKDCLLILSGVGLLLGEAWGRTLMLVYGVWGVAEVLLHLAIGRWTVMGSLAPFPGWGMPEEGQLLFLLTTAVVGGFYPTLQLVVGNLRPVRRYFDLVPAAEPAEAPAGDRPPPEEPAP